MSRMLLHLRGLRMKRESADLKREGQTRMERNSPTCADGCATSSEKFHNVILCCASLKDAKLHCGKGRIQCPISKTWQPTSQQSRWMKKNMVISVDLSAFL